MTRDKIHEDLQRLRAEVKRTTGNDPEARQSLNQLINDLEARLSQATAAGDKDDQDLVSRIVQAIENFETEHPRATSILNEIMVTLSNMGI